MPTAKVSDINIYYETHGEGETLVLIMGYGGHIGWWFRQLPVFSQECRVIAFDNRGTGRSDKPDIPYTMEMMTGDTAGLLEAIGIRAAHILGHSMGGSIAQHFALRYPKRVASLILASTGCGDPHAFRLDAEATTALYSAYGRMAPLTPEEGLRELLPFVFSQEFIDNNPDIVEQVITKMAEYPTPIHGYVRQGEAMAGHDTYDRLPNIKIPTLVISGDADRLIPVENSRLLASRISNAELVILENTGHGFMETAEEANNKGLDFLRRHRRSG